MTEINTKTGTSIVKSAPPKETARITVKPNLPPSPARVGGNFPAKPAAGAVAAVAPLAATTGAAAAATAVPAKGSKPATTIVKTGTTKVASSTAKPATPVGAAAPGAVPVPAMQYQDEPSTLVTTIGSGALAVITWGTAAVLFASYFGMI